jgi:hypothetical protein
MRILVEALFSLRNGKIKVRRKVADAPLIINVKNYFYNETRIGRLSGMSSEFFHELGKKMFLWLEYKTSLAYWKRRFLYPGVILAGFFYGYFVVSDQISGNMYERGYNMPKHQPQDFT